MSSRKLSLRQIVVRTLFMTIAVLLVSWFFPHNEAFRYEYEVGKPWRYGRLTAPYDFAILRSDSALQQMEDSLQKQIVPRYILDPNTGAEAMRNAQSAASAMSSDAYRHLQQRLDAIYSQGVLSGEDKQTLETGHAATVLLRTTNSNTATSVPASQLMSEKEAYESLRNDSVYGHSYNIAVLRDLIRCNATADTAAMRIEYANLRQQVSATSGMVMAETRIIDQGEIVTPRTYQVLESYRREQQNRLLLSSSELTMFLGRVGIVALVLCSILLFMALYRPWLYKQQAEVFVAIASVVIMVLLTSQAGRIAVGAVYMVPIGIVTIILSTFHGSRTAYYCHVVMVLLCSFIAPSHYEYLVIQSIIGMIIVFSLKDGLTNCRTCLLHRYFRWLFL